MIVIKHIDIIFQLWHMTSIKISLYNHNIKPFYTVNRFILHNYANNVRCILSSLPSYSFLEIFNNSTTCYTWMVVFHLFLNRLFNNNIICQWGDFLKGHDKVLNCSTCSSICSEVLGWVQLGLLSSKLMTLFLTAVLTEQFLWMLLEF